MHIEKLVVCIFVYKDNSPLHGFWIMLGNFQYCDPIATPFVFFSLASSCHFSFMLGGFSERSKGQNAGS